MANSVDPDQTAPIGAVCFGSMLFASILNSSVMLGNYLQQTTSTVGLWIVRQVAIRSDPRFMSYDSQIKLRVTG